MFNSKLKKIVFGLLVCLLSWSPLILLAATESGNVNIGATVPSTDEEPNPSPSPTPLPTTSLEIVPVLGTVTQDCGSVTLSWKTELVTNNNGTITRSDISASTEVGYGIGSANENVVTGLPGINHSLTIDNLAIGQEYRYYVRSEADSLSRQDSGGTFTVVCTLANPTVIAIPDNQGADINITYPDEPDIVRLVIVRDVDNPPQDIGQGEMIYDGPQIDFFNDPSIALNEEYYYSAFICNSYNYCSGAFDDARRSIPEVSNIEFNRLDGALGVSWTNPGNDLGTDFTLSGIRVIRTDSDCESAGPNDGSQISEGLQTNMTDSPLDNDQVYFYKFFVKNSYGEYSQGVCRSAQPQAGLIDYCPSNVNVVALADQVSLSWQNPVLPPEAQLNNLYWQRDSQCLTSHDAGQRIYTGLAESVTDNQVEPEQMYAYSLFVDYEDGQINNCGCYFASLTEEIEITDQHPPVNFFTNDGALQLWPQASQLFILTDYPLTVNVIRSLAPKPVQLITLEVNDNSYFLALDSLQDIYQASFSSPVEAGSYDLVITTVYTDKTESILNYTLQVLPWGQVYAGQYQPQGIEDVELLLRQDGQIMTGYGVSNPGLTNSQGYYDFMVPNGRYTLQLTKTGYETKYVDINVTNNVINDHIRLETTDDWLDILSAFLDDPLVEEINSKYVAPGLMAFSAVALLSGIPWWNVWRFFQYLFTEPFAYIFARKRKGYGVVYNSITKEPIDLAIVRLYQKENGKLIQSRVTDPDGRYNFLVDVGSYYLEAGKPGMIFPSEILKEAEMDRQYLNLYHGQDIVIHEGEKGLVTANIPLDPEDVQVTDRQVIRKYNLFAIRQQISLIGPVLALISMIISPSALTLAFLMLHIGLFFLFDRLAAEKKRNRSWGIIMDAETDKPLHRAVARIYAPEFNRMLEAQVTDRYGRYGFLAGNAVYYITTNKEGYAAFKTDNIDLSHQKANQVIGQDIKMLPEYEQVNDVQAVIDSSAVKSSQTPVEPISPASVEPISPVTQETSELEEMAAKLKEQVENSRTTTVKPSLLKEDKFG